MIKQYTRQQMLQIWKRRKGWAGSAQMLSAEDATELDEWLLDEIDVWYAKCLREAPSTLLPTADLATLATVTPVDGRCVEIDLPDRMVRPLLLRFRELSMPVARFPEPDAVTETYLSCFAFYPVERQAQAFLHGRKLLVYGDFATPPTLVQFFGVARPEGDDIVLDESLLPSTV